MMRLGFTKKEIYGVLFLVALLISSISFNRIMVNNKNQLDREYAAAFIDSILRLDTLQRIEKLLILKGKDPNNVSFDTLLLAGFDKNVCERWLKFRAAGYRFVSSNDIYKIYGIDSVLCQLSSSMWLFQPKPLVKGYLKSGKQSFKSKYVKKYNQKNTKVPQHPTKKSKVLRASTVKDVKIIELNSATVESLLPLYGIGPVLSKRILKFKDLLGGYTSVNQLKEVYGLRSTLVDSLKPFFKVDKTKIHRIDLSKTSYSQLIRHPYIDKAMTRFLLDFRAVSSSVSIRDFAIKKNIDSLKIKKIIPYVEINW